MPNANTWGLMAVTPSRTLASPHIWNWAVHLALSETAVRAAQFVVETFSLSWHSRRWGGCCRGGGDLAQAQGTSSYPSAPLSMNEKKELPQQGDRLGAGQGAPGVARQAQDE